MSKPPRVRIPIMPDRLPGETIIDRWNRFCAKHSPSEHDYYPLTDDQDFGRLHYMTFGGAHDYLGIVWHSEDASLLKKPIKPSDFDRIVQNANHPVSHGTYESDTRFPPEPIGE